jgi:septum formation protein
MQKIILASQSPRRKALLELAGLQFEIVAKGTDETFPPDMPTEEVPIYLARAKAHNVNKYLDSAYHAQHSTKTILAADTIVVLDETVINKPENRAEAIAMLSSLSGRKHRVITGVVLLDDDGETSFHDITEVEFHPLSIEQIEFYVDKCSPFDKAGAYAIQEWIGAVGIKSINGDFYNVMGLPISRVIQELEKFTSRSVS